MSRRKGSRSRFAPGEQVTVVGSGYPRTLNYLLSGTIVGIEWRPDDERTPSVGTWAYRVREDNPSYGAKWWNESSLINRVATSNRRHSKRNKRTSRKKRSSR